MRTALFERKEPRTTAQSSTMPAAVSALMMVGALLLSACAFDLAHVPQTPTELRERTSARASFVIDRAIEFDIGLGYRRTLKQGTRWTYAGTIAAGDVYRSRDQVLTVEASNMHEAYLVIDRGRMVGFYLPVERTFSPLTTPVLVLAGDG